MNAYFKPSYYSHGIYGDAESAPSAAEVTGGGTVRQPPTGQQIATLVTSIATGVDAIQDPIRRAEVIRAKIENYQKMRTAIPALAWWYDNQLNILAGKLRAAEYEAAAKRQSIEATGTWRVLGQSGLAVGIGTGVIAAIALAGLAKRAWRK